MNNGRLHVGPLPFWGWLMSSTNGNYLVRASAFEGRVRAFAINATRAVAELRERQGTDPVTTAALGRLAAGTLLFGAMLKEEQQLVTIRVQGDGPAGTLLATANGAGDVRALVANPRPAVEQVRDGKLNVSGAVGTVGRITVTKDLGMRQPYMGIIEIVSGEIGEDLAHYLATSEQTPSAVGIGVFVESDGSVEAAGGYIVQIMPGLPDRDLITIEESIRALPHPTTMLRAGDSPEDVLARIFGSQVNFLDRLPVRFHCPCSRERAERALMLLGSQVIDELIAGADDGATELTCEFCGEIYPVSVAELQALRGE
jgi:molecular chaperone Hsp33